MRRREFLSGALALGITSRRMALGAPAQTSRNVLDYGADPDGKELSTRAIQRAIDDAFKAGGGTVRFPAGTFLTGRIDLKSRVTIYLEAKCTILGSTSLHDYERPADNNPQQRHLIFAIDAEEIRIGGPGRIDGQGPSFWEPSGRTPVPPDQQWRAVASHALKPKASGRPSPMLCFVNCRGVRIEDVRIENSPGWTINAVNCDDVLIERIAIRNPVDGPNTDGIDLTGCQNATITNCTVDTGDDAICLKSVNPYGPEPRLIRNIRVTHCTLSTCCNAFKLGTDSQSGFEDITFSNCTIENQNAPFKDRVISGVALEVVDGGWIDGVTVTGIRMQRARAPIFIHLGNRRRPREHHGLRNVRIDDVQASDALLASSITGLPGTYVHDLTLSNIRVVNILPLRSNQLDRTVPEKPTQYPEAWMFGMLPASGLFARHVRNLDLSRITISSAAGEERPAILLEDVIGSTVTEFSSTPIAGAMPLMRLTDCRTVRIEDSSAPAGTHAFLGVDGAQSGDIELFNDDLHNAKTPVEISGGAAKQAVRTIGNDTGRDRR